jgi:riboflavin transporter FmnP
MREDMNKVALLVSVRAGLSKSNFISYGVAMNNQTQQATTTKNHFNTRTLVSVAMLAAISYVLAFIEIQVPLSPTFAKMDLSDFPALIAAFAINPLAGVIVEAIKNGLQLMSTSTGGIGELANFLMGSALAFTAGLFYHKLKTKKRAVLGCVLGTIAMAITAAILNYFVLLPLYSTFMPIEQVIEAFAAFIPFINTKLDVVLFNAIPFNLFKGAIISILTILVYKRLSPILKGW